MFKKVANLTLLKPLWSMLLVSTVFFTSLSVTYIAWHNAKNETFLQLQNTFSFQSQEIINRIKFRLDAYEQVLRGARGLFTASTVVERNEFKTYVENLQLKEHYPGIQGVGFSLIIPKEQEKQHIAEMHKQGFKDYRLRRESEQEFFTSIIYLEPFKDRNLRAFGYDMYSESVQRTAMQKARDLNQAAISGKVKLLQETEKNVQAGFLMYLPLYKNQTPHTTLTERRHNISGWVYETFRMDDFMQGLNHSLLNRVNLEIYDNKTMTESTRMFDSDKISNSCHHSASQLHRITFLSLKEHQWILVMCPTPQLEITADKDKQWIIAITGVLLSGLLTLITWQLLSSRRRALALANKMLHKSAESETRFRIMANSAPVLIWIADVNTLCVWFNKTWLNFTGRLLAQELDNGWTANVHPDDLQAYLACYLNHFNRHENFTIEYRLKRYDGQYRWFLNSGVPRLDKDGNFAGFIGCCIDITDRKQIESALQRSNADLTRFAEISAHHLMEPVRRLTSYTQRLTKLLAPYLVSTPSSQEINDCFSYLQNDAKCLRNRLQAIQLYLAAAESHEPVQPHDVNLLLTQLQKRFKPKLQALNVELIVQNLPSAYLDRPRLLDLFSIIIDNALTHGFSTPAIPTPQIIICGARLGKLSRYAITDNGCGIPAEYHERVFEIFEQLKHNHALGRGAGLAIARRIVESQHGKIWIENPPHSGTTVIFELPDGDE